LVTSLIVTSEEPSGEYRAEIKDSLGEGEVGRKPFEVIVSGNTLFYFRSWTGGNLSQNARAKSGQMLGFLKIWMRQTSFCVCWDGHEELRKKKEQGKKRQTNRKLWDYW